MIGFYDKVDLQYEKSVNMPASNIAFVAKKWAAPDRNFQFLDYSQS